MVKIKSINLNIIINKKTFKALGFVPANHGWRKEIKKQGSKKYYLHVVPISLGNKKIGTGVHVDKEKDNEHSSSLGVLSELVIKRFVKNLIKYHSNNLQNKIVIKATRLFIKDDKKVLENIYKYGKVA